RRRAERVLAARGKARGRWTRGARVAGPRTRVVHEPYARSRSGGTGTTLLGTVLCIDRVTASARATGASRLLVDGCRSVGAASWSGRCWGRWPDRGAGRPPEPDEGVWNSP